jgi:ATP-dependent helicase YprA (DUF1998 family)
MENSPATAAVPQVDPLSGYVPKADYDKLVVEHSTLKSVFEDAKQDFTGRLAAIEDARRKEQIISIVSAKIADEKKAGELVTKFVDAKVSPEFVRETLSYLPEQNTPQRDNTEKFTAPVQASVATGNSKWFDSYLANESAIIRGTKA